MRESSNTERFIALGLEQWNQLEVSVRRTEGLGHDVLNLSPFAVEVVRCHDYEYLAALTHTALYLGNARCAAAEVSEINERSDSGVLDAWKELAANPLFVTAAIGDEDVHLCLFVSACVPLD